MHHTSSSLFDYFYVIFTLITILVLTSKHLRSLVLPPTVAPEGLPKYARLVAWPSTLYTTGRMENLLRLLASSVARIR